MSIYFIITTSAFLNWSSELDSTIIKATKKLFDKLRILTQIDTTHKVFVVQATDKSVQEKVGDDNLWAYNFIKAHYEIAPNSDGEEMEAVIDLADKKSKLFDKVIIINSSNAYDEEPKIKSNAKIEIMKEDSCLSFVIKNCNL